jgi:type III restriction enzyme
LFRNDISPAANEPPELLDGRKLVVEYKGEDYMTNDDSKEKSELGELWERRSGGHCLFLMATKRDALGRDPYEQIKAKIETQDSLH